MDLFDALAELVSDLDLDDVGRDLGNIASEALAEGWDALKQWWARFTNAGEPPAPV